MAFVDPWAFQMFSTYYKDYADFLGSWGYVVVQYDLPAMTITTDKLEVRRRFCVATQSCVAEDLP